MQNNKKPAIIVDIDGTAALGINKHRGPYDYNLCGDDEPNLPVWLCISLFFDRFIKSGEGKIVFLSGRENVSFPGKSERKDITYRRALYDGKEHKSCYDLTEHWIYNNFKKFVSYKPFYPGDTDSQYHYWELHMRPEGIYLEDSEVKYQMYKDIVEDEYAILFVLDDRDQVVNMWRNHANLSCFQVAPGNF